MQFSLIQGTLLLSAVAQAWNPGNSYAPTRIECPSDESTFIQSAHSVSEKEEDWISERHKVTAPKLIEFLNRMNMTDFNATSFLSNTTVSIGLAFSGGGYRAMLAGAGEFSALDERTTNSTNSGHLGGLVQASTYFAGLSGGNWMLNSIVLNNFTSVQALQGDKDIWDLTASIFNPGGINIFSTASYYDRIADEVEEKKDAGFNISITDIWGRALSEQFIGLKHGGPALQFSDVRNYDAFTSHEMPFPLIVSVGRAPGTKIISTNSTVFEITPFHLGSWDPSLYAFTDTYYLGSNVSNGKPLNSTSCVTGFDNGGFILGTSSSLFNQFILQLNSTGISGVVYKLAHSILTDLDEKDNDIAIYAPNPFYGLNSAHSIPKAEYLSLVDGGEDNQNVPLYPLQQPSRNVDVIFAYDNSADTDYSWPNGASIGATYARQFGDQGNHSFFPSVPDNNTFVNLGLNTRPVFFGCYASNFTELRTLTDSADDYTPPLIVWNSNYPYSYYSNTSTFKMTYETDEVAGMIQNGYNVATRGNSTEDSEWGACVGCAIIQREIERRGMSQTEQCQRCFQKYCWNGTLDATTPSEAYEPAVKTQTMEAKAGKTSKSSSSSGSDSGSSKLIGSSALVAAISFAVMLM